MFYEENRSPFSQIAPPANPFQPAPDVEIIEDEEPVSEEEPEEIPEEEPEAEPAEEPAAEEEKYMKIALEKINGCNTISEIMGYEGTAAKYYFKALSKSIEKEFQFAGRSRRPPMG